MPGELNIEHVELVPPTVNTEQRCLCVLLLDNSGSMSGEPIQHLNEGLKVFYEELKKDALAMLRVEIAIITFGPVCLLQDFIPAQHFVPPSLQSAGDTPMGEAILLALKKIKARKEELAKAGISHYRPWAFLISDGAPTDGEQFIHACKKSAGSRSSQASAFLLRCGGQCRHHYLKPDQQQASSTAIERVAIPRIIPMAQREYRLRGTV